MPEPQLTDERLRFHLDGNQPMRERLCAALLPLVGPYSDIKLRRPRGGPDGGRDLEAIYNQSLLVWGAVGFQNSVHDSAQEKVGVRRKFGDDLERALSEKPDLKGFIFFTNVDLTPAEQSTLKAEADQRGLVFVEVFYRERLRMVLDSPAGLGVRFQYLGLPLSEAEQIAFFSHYGARLEQLVAEGFGSVDAKLRRIEFLQDCSKPLVDAHLIVELNRGYSADELGHFRILAKISSSREPGPPPMLYLAGRDGHNQLRGLAWSRNPDEQITGSGFRMQGPMRSLDVRLYVYKKGPFPTLGSLDQCKLSVYITKPLFEQTSHIGLTVNGYMVAGHHVQELAPIGDYPAVSPLVEWSGELTEAERRVPWLELLIKALLIKTPETTPGTFDLPWARLMGWPLRFDAYTPEKVR